MFKITIPPLINGNNYKVSKVRYIIASDPSFNNVIEDVTKEQDIYEYITELDFINNNIYYVRVIFHFTDGTQSNPSKPIVVTKDSNGVLLNNNIIKTPVLTIEEDINNTPLGNFRITTSPFELVAGNGIHKYTYWEIRDMFNNLVWSRHKDSSNLYNIWLPDNILEPNKAYILKAKYVTNTGGHSNWGRLYIKSNKDDQVCNPKALNHTIQELKYVIDMQMREIVALNYITAMNNINTTIFSNMYNTLENGK